MKVNAIDGVPVIDAKAPLTLTITKRDCNNGDPKEPDTCAAARALRREHGVADCRVHLGRIYIRQNKGNWQRFLTPKSLRSEIIAFDRGGAFSPGEYTLSPLPPANRTTGKRQGSKPKFKQARDNPKRKKRTKHVVADVRNGPSAAA